MGAKNKALISLYQVKSFPIILHNLQRPNLTNPKFTSAYIYT